jgi:hypothetical protein
MNPLEYLRLQLRLEGKELLHNNLLRQVEILPDEEMPLMVIAQLSGSNLVAYFDQSLQIDFREDLKEQFSTIRFPNIEPVYAFLQSRNITFGVGHYKTYIFPERYVSFADTSVGPFSKYDPKAQVFGFDGLAEQVYGIERDDQIISACVSARENDFCGEAWVYTDPEYRHQGFAQKVVGVWATSLLLAGKVPFYSHKIENNASANLAKRLGLEPVFEEIVISYGSQ